MEQLSIKELQNKLQGDKYALPRKTLFDVYTENKNDSSTQKEYILFLERYIPFFRNTTISELISF
jgi:hypothetical protein